MKKEENTRGKNIGKDNDKGRGNSRGRDKSRESEEEKEIERQIKYIEFAKANRQFIKTFSEKDMDKDEDRLFTKLERIKRFRKGNRPGASK